MKFCTQCGHPLGDEDRFCASCGTPVTESKAEEVPSQKGKGSQTQNAIHPEPIEKILNVKSFFTDYSDFDTWCCASALLPITPILYYMFIMLDGKKTPEEKNKFKKICESTGVSEQDRSNAVLYYDDHITADDAKRLPQIAVALRELIAKIQPDSGFRSQPENHPNNLLPIYGAILWNLIDLGYSDTEICDEEKGFISILAEAWKFPKADLLQMYDTAETLMDLSRKKVWLKQTDLPYDVITKKVEKLDRDIDHQFISVNRLISETGIA